MEKMSVKPGGEGTTKHSKTRKKTKGKSMGSRNDALTRF